MKDTTRILLISAALGTFCCLLAGLPGTARASGGGEPVDLFVSRDIPDIHPDRYERGDLGIVQPSYQRLYLYPAWRAIVLGRLGAAAAAKNHGLAHAVLVNGATGWYIASSDAAATVVGAWNNASRSYADPDRRGAVQDMRAIPEAYSSYVVCGSSAFTFATQTLNAIRERRDATPERIQSWVKAQDSVFRFCDYDAKLNPYEHKKAASEPPIPEPLPRSEPDYWRQLRQYQIAAAHFYNDKYHDSAEQFAKIGAEKSHPMRVWGAYLALRSHLRAAELSREPDERRKQHMGQMQSLKNTLSPGAWEEKQKALAPEFEQAEQHWRDEHLAALERDAKRILADPSLSEVHNATRALLRRAKARFAPLTRIGEMAGYLDDPALDPQREDHLSDWAFLMAGQTQYGKNKAFLEEQYQKHPFMRWIDSLQQCGQYGNALKWEERSNDGMKSECLPQYQFAVSRWKQLASGKSAQRGEAAAWLVASLMLAVEPTPDLKAAALAVQRDAPEYLTVRYHLARLYRLAADQERPAGGAEPRKRQQARAIADEVLNADSVTALASPSVINLLKQERFGTATSVSDATNYLLRQSTMPWIANVGAQRPPTTEAEIPKLQADGVRWLNSALSLQDVLSVARDGSLPVAVRTQLATVAWLRADLLGQWRLADDAAQVVAQLSPALNSVATGYLRNQAPEEKHHAMLLIALRYGVSAYASTYPVRFDDKDWRLADPDSTTARMWCRLPDDADASSQGDAAAEHVPAPPAVTTDAALRDAETKSLASFKSATGYVGDHVLQWALTHPADPDLPWLLHVVVQSTRGGCLDKDASTLSKTAFSLLHKRYPNNEWARATPYWY